MECALLALTHALPALRPPSTASPAKDFYFYTMDNAQVHVLKTTSSTLLEVQQHAVSVEQDAKYARLVQTAQAVNLPLL